MTILKMSNAGGMITANRYATMLAGNSSYIPSDYESIATVTVGAGGVSSVTFSSIPATYQHLQLRVLARSTRGATDDDLKLTFNGTTTNYYRHEIYGTGSTVSAYASTGTAIEVGHLNGSTSAASYFAATILDILDYTNTNKNTTTRSLSGGMDLDRIKFMSGGWFNTSAVTSISLTAANGNLVQYSSFALYGIKG
jgi:hypothetical protein